jgi:hypothetical protein
MNDGGDGGDVAQQRKPDTIQREIEQTRAELADTIDAIADRISPRRAASRGAHAVKAQVSSVLGGSGNGSAPAGAPAGGLDTPARSVADTGTSGYVVNRRLRVDRVLLAVGAVAAVVGAIVLWRSRD